MKLGRPNSVAGQGGRNGARGAVADGKNGQEPHHGRGRAQAARADGAGREQILAAARALFLERNYAEVSMQQIADAVGMTKAALYYHFEDKVDLFANVVLGELRTGIKSIEDAIAAGGYRDEILLRAATRLYEFSQPRAIQLLEEFSKVVPEARNADVHLEFLRMQEMAMRCFSAPTRDGREWEVPPDLAAMMFMHLAGSLIPHHPHPYPDIAASAETRGKLLVQIFLHGMDTPFPAALAEEVKNAPVVRAGEAGSPRPAEPAPPRDSEPAGESLP